MLIAPLALKLSLPVLIVVCSAWICRRYTWKRHPGLLTQFLAATCVYLLAMLWYGGYRWGIPVGLICGTVGLLEVLTFSRLKPSDALRNAVIAGTVCVCALLAMLPRGLTVIQRINLFRQYYYLALASVGVWAFVYRLIHPLSSTCVSIRRERTSYPECFRHKAQRAGTAAWLLAYALSGTFVAGGLGYIVFPYTQRTFYAAEFVNIVVMLIVIGAMTLAMVSSPGRKHAAKRRDGRTATGLIEMERRGAA